MLCCGRRHTAESSRKSVESSQTLHYTHQRVHNTSDNTHSKQSSQLLIIISGRDMAVKVRTLHCPLQGDLISSRSPRRCVTLNTPATAICDCNISTDTCVCILRATGCALSVTHVGDTRIPSHAMQLICCCPGHRI